jgi:hypothetical protein
MRPFPFCSTGDKDLFPKGPKGLDRLSRVDGPKLANPAGVGGDGTRESPCRAVSVKLPAWTEVPRSGTFGGLNIRSGRGEL